MMLAVYVCSLCMKRKGGLRDVFCGSSISNLTRSECAVRRHHTSRLSRKVPQTTVLTWSGDARRGLRMTPSFEAHPIHRHRLNICNGPMVGSRMGADKASQHGPPGRPKWRPTERDQKTNQHVDPTLWIRTVRVKSVGANFWSHFRARMVDPKPCLQVAPGNAALLVAACCRFDSQGWGLVPKNSHIHNMPHSMT